MNHGGAGTAYSHYGCRCEECTEANRSRAAKRRAERKLEPKTPDDPRHGKATFYSNHGCHCEKCTAAWNEKCKQGYHNRKARKQ